MIRLNYLEPVIQTVWSTNMTPGEISDGPTGYCGANPDAPSECIVKSSHAPYGSIDDDNFTFGGEEYTVMSLRYGVYGDKVVDLSLDSELEIPDDALEADAVLQIGGESYNFSLKTDVAGDPASRYSWETDPSPGPLDPIPVSRFWCMTIVRATLRPCAVWKILPEERSAE